MARGHDGTIVQSAAFCPNRVLDTLGAGDTFCAATIFGLSRGKSLQDCVILGCQIAGLKVGMEGFTDLQNAYIQLKNGSGQL
jgi:ketohexokinase